MRKKRRFGIVVWNCHVHLIGLEILSPQTVVQSSWRVVVELTCGVAQIRVRIHGKLSQSWMPTDCHSTLIEGLKDLK